MERLLGIDRLLHHTENTEVSATQRTDTPPHQRPRAALVAIFAVLLAACPYSIGHTFMYVVMGDSHASGEGNPDVAQHFGDLGLTIKAGPKWVDKRCHRSDKSGFHKAADRLPGMINLPADGKIIFFSEACTGAGILEGLLGPYNPDPKDHSDSLIPQIQAVKNFVGPAQIDALVISAGGNDMGFGDLVRDCLKQDTTAVAQTALGAPRLLCGSDPSVNKKYLEHLNDLPRRYDLLADAIRENLNVTNVYLTEYADPTHDSDGSFCTMRILVEIMSSASSQWAHDVILKGLNQAVRNAAEKHKSEGWFYVGGVETQFKTHGYCAGSQRWWTTDEDARNTQGPYDLGIFEKSGFDPSKGMMHPNGTGHEIYAQQIVNTIAGTWPPPIRDWQLVKGSAPNVYYVVNGKREWIMDPPTLNGWFGGVPIRTVPDATLGAIPEGPHFPEGQLARGSTPEIFFIEKGQRRYIPDPTTFKAWGFRDDQVKNVPDAILNVIPKGTNLGMPPPL